MERLVTSELLKWKDSPGRKPLIVRGARQVGKSWSINEFGHQAFSEGIVSVNLEKNPDFHPIFAKNLDAPRILFELELLLNKKIVAGSSLLFFDEIQECPNAIKALRYFYEQVPALHVLAAGSLLEFAFQDISFPVGRVQLLNMHPMNFHEYLKAIKKDLLAETLLKEPIELSEAVHDAIREELRNYFVIGGMPECVKTFVDTKSYRDVLQVQENLLATFRQDFSKYAPYSDKQCLNQVFASVAQYVGQQIKYTRLSDSFSSPTIRKAFELLERARLFKKVKAATPQGVPLGATARENIFKALFLDIGLLSCINNLTHKPDFQKQNLLAIFKGALAEQFVGQEIASSGHENLYYWSRQAKSSSAETDFLVEADGDIIPVEVKSGPAGSLKSLHLLFTSYKNITKAYIFSDQKYGRIDEQKLVFYPLYCAYPVLKKESPF